MATPCDQMTRQDIDDKAAAMVACWPIADLKQLLYRCWDRLAILRRLNAPPSIIGSEQQLLAIRRAAYRMAIYATRTLH